MNINELKVIIAEVLEEAKKKKEKEIKARENHGKAKNAYGYYSEALDFSWPLGPYNLYGQQGQVNWGPYTSGGQKVDQNFANPNTGLNMRENDEKALRAVVREVIEYGLVPSDSAWAPIMEASTPKSFDTPWEAAINECAWYMQHTELNGVPEGGPKKRTKIDKTKYGKIVKYGPPEEAKNKRVK